MQEALSTHITTWLIEQCQPITSDSSLPNNQIFRTVTILFDTLTLFRIDLSEAAHGWAAKKPLIIITIHNITKKNLITSLRLCCRCVNVRLTFVNSSTSMREVIITSTLEGLGQKNQFFEGCSWFKLNNLGLGLGMTLMFYKNVAKGLKLKVRKFWVPSLTFVEVRGKKPVGDLFGSSILNRVNIDT